MKDHIVVGTVRARKGDNYVVVTKDGSTVEANFAGGRQPLIGGDIIGVFQAGPTGALHLSLKDTLTDAMLSTSTTFMVAGARPDITARMLAKMLSRQKSAVLAPGAGMAIQRKPHSSDPDLQWALNILSPEADRLQVALNVIDVKSLTSNVWQSASIRDMALPADIEGNRRSMFELTSILRSGFHPECSRMMENVSGNRDISINFVMPYSPFLGSLGFARNVGAMNSNYFPTVDWTVSDARRLSSARMIGLAMAHKALSVSNDGQADVEQSSRSRHIANSFADALAALTFLRDGGDPKVIGEFADLREASLCFGYDAGQEQVTTSVLEDATHRSIKSVLKDYAAGKVSTDVDPARLVAMAARTARKNAIASSSFEAGYAGVSMDEMDGAVEAANRVAFDLRHATHQEVGAFGAIYASDLKHLVNEHGDNDRSASRMITFGGNHIPHRMNEIFAAETRELSDRFDPEAVEVELTGSKTMANTLLDRIRLKRTEQADINRLQFGETLVR